jgi:hypothetical protein
MEAGHSVLKLSCYSTPSALFAALALVFEVQEGDKATWVSFKTDAGVELTFFTADAADEVQA